MDECKRAEKPTTPEQCALIALAEYKYWSDAGTVDGIAGSGAAANIYAAITLGMMAPWHPGYPKTVDTKESV